MKLHKVLLPVVLSLFLLGAGCSFTQTVNINANASIGNAYENTNTSTGVTYAGQEGKNALELLQAEHVVDASAEGFVNAIDGVKPGSREFWAFYVNGKQAEVGAKDYVTKDSDQVEWKLEAF